jgi:hypothetical protein
LSLLRLSGASDGCGAALLGAFDTDTDEVTLIDRGQRLDDIEAVFLLLHEYVHALQSDLDLPSPEQLTFDQELAIRTVLEGDASLAVDRARAQYANDAPAGPLDYLADARQSLRLFRIAGSPVDTATGYFAYSFGTALVAEARFTGGSPAVARLLRAPPSGSSEVLEELGFMPPSDAEVAETWAPELSGAKLQVRDSFGPFVFDGWLHTLSRSASAPLDPASLQGIARGWQADELTVLTRTSDGAVLTLYRIELGDVARLVELRELIAQSGLRSFLVELESRPGLLAVAASDPAWAAELDPDDLAWRLCSLVDEEDPGSCK